MTMETHTEANPLSHSRRRLIQKAAYTAPAIFALAAAPNVALGGSGPDNPRAENEGLTYRAKTQKGKKKPRRP